MPYTKLVSSLPMHSMLFSSTQFLYPEVIHAVPVPFLLYVSLASGPDQHSPKIIAKLSQETIINR